MKPFLVMLIAAVVGVSVSWTWSANQAANVVHVFGDTEVRETPTSFVAEDGTAKLTIIGEPTHNFGTMIRMEKGKCSFKMRNDGDATLTLELDRTTCKCTSAEFQDDTLAPGQTTSFDLEWEGKLAGFDPDFRQEAHVTTNDPEQRLVTFAIEGKLFFEVEATPPVLGLGSISSKESFEKEIELYCYTQEDFQITNIMQEDKVLANLIDVELTAVSAEELAAKEGAKAGYRAKVSIDAGLPPGRVSQLISFVTNVEEKPSVDIPVEAQVASDIKLLGPNYSRESNVLTIGRVASDKGGKANLQILISGEHYDKTTFQLQSSDPDVIEIEVGEGKQVGDRPLMRYPLTVRIPTGLDPIDRRGTTRFPAGAVVLETTHPEIKQVQFWVRFAVE